jgi:hypothetical protein
LTGSTVWGNTAGRDGGGAFIETGKLPISNSHFAHNVAGRNGGGLYIGAGTASILDSIFSGNKTKKGGLGTAIYTAQAATLNLDDDTVISQNGVSIFQELDLL